MGDYFSSIDHEKYYYQLINYLCHRIRDYEYDQNDETVIYDVCELINEIRKGTLVI